MKKLLSLLLSAALLLTTVSGLSLTAYAGETINAGTIAAGDTKWVNIENAGDIYSYTFTPEKDGYYVIESYYDDNNYDTYVELYGYVNDDGSQYYEQITSDDDGGESNYFRLSYRFTAGEEYTFKIRMLNDDETGGFYVDLSYLDLGNITGISASFDNNTLVENINGYEDSVETDWNEETETWNYESFYHYDVWSLINNCSVTIHYSDKEDETVSYYQLAGEKSYTDNQYDEHWTVGNTYDVTVRYLDFETKAPVTIIPNPVKAVEYLPANGPIELIENLDGYHGNWASRNHYDEESGEWVEDERYFEYQIREDEGDKIIITDSDNNKTEYVYGRYYNAAEDYYTWGYHDENDNGIPYDFNFNTYESQNNEHWKVGNTYPVTLKCMNQSYTFNVKIVENPVESIEFVYKNYDEINLIENTSSGRWSTTDDGARFYRYYYPDGDSYGNQLIAHLKDGTTKIFTYLYSDEEAGREESGFYDEDGNEIDFFGYADGQYEKPWTVDGDNYIEFTYYSVPFRYPVNVVKNPVKAISYTPASPIELVFEANGDYETDNNGESYFRYNYGERSLGDKLTVTYTDGTSKEYTYQSKEFYDEEDDYTHTDSDFYDANGTSIDDANDYYGYWSSVGFSANQEEEHWTIGGDNKITVSYMGASATIPVTIKESPVKSISLELAEDIVLFENYSHHGNFRTDQKTGEKYFYYSAYNINYSSGKGNKLTVNYKDGSTVVYTYDGRYFLAPDGSTPEYDLTTLMDQETNHWTVGDNYFQRGYAGAKADVKVTVTQSPVKSISYTPTSEIKLIEGEDGWSRWGKDGEEYWYYDFPYAIGDKLTVNYKDGTKKEYTYQKIETENGYYSTWFYDTDGNRLYYWLDDSSDQSESNLWTAGNTYQYKLTYVGAETTVPVSIIQNPVKSIEFVMTHKYVYYGNANNGRSNAGYFLSDGDAIKVTYQDGTTDKLTYNAEKDCFVNNKGNFIDKYQYLNYHFDEESKTLKVTYLGSEGTLPVTCIDADSIKTISYTPANKVVLSSDKYAYYYFDGGKKYVYYKTGLPKDGDKITVTLTNGTSTVYTCKAGAFIDSNNNMFFNAIYDTTSDSWGEGGSEADFSECFFIDSYKSQRKQQWTKGNTYQVPVTFCGKESSIEVTLSGEHTHEYTTKVIAPTCTQQGYTLHSCKYCDDNYKDNYKPALDHTPAPAVKMNIVEATTASEGSYDLIVYCKTCGTELSREHITVPKLPTGWVKTGNKWNYYDADGDKTTGWQKIGGKWYLFSYADGTMLTGWVKSGGKWYYFNASGAMLTGWQKIGGKWYYFNASGAMLTGWQKISGKWYYFNGSGAMLTGWQKLSGKWYYFDGSGVMKSGWVKLSGKWYYFNSDGSMVTGSKKIGSKVYKFNASGVCTNP